MAIDIDGVLEAIGDVGPYQRRIYFLLCLPIIFVAASNLSYVFIAATPHYRCLIAGCDNVTCPTYHEPFLNYTIPWDQNLEEFESCQEYSRKPRSNFSTCLKDDFTENVEACIDGILFDNSIYESTIITEFNLTCSKNWEGSADQVIYFTGVLVSAIMSGILADLFGRRKVILISIFFLAVSGIAVALMMNIYCFHVLRFISAMAANSLYQTAFILGMEFVGPRHRVMFGIVGQFFFAFGEVFLGLVAWGIRRWRMIQFIISTPVVCFTFYYWIVPESVRWLQAKGRHAKVIAGLENIAKINKKPIPLSLLRHRMADDDEADENEDEIPLLLNHHHKVTLFDILKSPIMAVRTIFMISIWISVTLTYYGLSFNATDLATGNDTNKPYINFILSSLVEIPGYAIAWMGMEYWGRRGAIFCSLLIAGSACITAGYVKGFLPVLLTFLIGKCNITCAFAIIYVLTAEMFPTSVRTTIVGICSMFARIGAMMAPFSKSLKEIYRPLPLLLFGALSIVSSLLSLVMAETLNTKLPETVKEAVNLGKRDAIHVPNTDDDLMGCTEDSQETLDASPNNDDHSSI